MCCVLISSVLSRNMTSRRMLSTGNGGPKNSVKPGHTLVYPTVQRGIELWTPQNLETPIDRFI